MKSQYTTLLAQTILSLLDKPVAKVRLAKLMYFSFKELVDASVLNINDMMFIRMPLGPVPVGFSNLHADSCILVEHANVGLTYNRENYSLQQGINIENSFTKHLSHKLTQYDKYPTSYLIEKSHSDDSWLSHANGEEYFITPKDLANMDLPPLPHHITDEIDNQMIQSRLISGMESEIIKDSSALEYPDAYSN